MPQGLYFPGYSMEDANPDIGDSAICETIGIGGVAMGAAPAVVRFVGAGSVSEAMEYSRSMQEIAVGPSPHYLMPAMDFAGTATGLDIRKVVATGILPVINTGIAHKMPGVGQILSLIHIYVDWCIFCSVGFLPDIKSLRGSIDGSFG